MDSKKRVYIIAVAVLVIIGAAVGYFMSQKQEAVDDRQEIAVTSGGANFSPKQNIDLQQGLVNLVGKYTEAVILTNSVFFTDIEKTDYDDWQAKLDRAIELWDELEGSNTDMNELLDEMGIPKTEDIAFGQALMEYAGTGNVFSFIPVAHAAEPSDALPELGAVTAVFDSAPHGQKLRRVMEVFGWDARKALAALKQEGDLMESEAWDKAGDTYQRWETAARVIKDASKVAVFVGTNIITAGGATAAVGAFQGVALVVGGVSLAIEVGEDINIALGNEDDAAVLRQAQKDMGPLTYLISIASLKDIGDPNNMFFIADQAGKLYNYAKDGYVYVTRSSDGKIYVSKQKPKDVQLPVPKPNSDPKQQGLTPGNYIVEGEEVEVKDEDTEVVDDVEALSGFETPENPVIDPDSTKIRTGEVNNLSLEIPEGLKGPFDIESIEVGGSGAAVSLPSESDGRTIDGQFISSNPGTYVVQVRIRDADGNIYITKTTISVEGEPTGEPEEEDVDVDEYIEEEQIGLTGNVTANSAPYRLQGIDSREHRLQGSGTMSMTILEDTIFGESDIKAQDYWKCPVESVAEAMESCGGEWLTSAAPPVVISGEISGSFNPRTKKIEGKIGEHYFTGTLEGNKASGKFYYELPNKQPAFFWSVFVK